MLNKKELTDKANCYNDLPIKFDALSLKLFVVNGNTSVILKEWNNVNEITAKEVTEEIKHYQSLGYSVSVIK